MFDIRIKRLKFSQLVPRRKGYKIKPRESINQLRIFYVQQWLTWARTLFSKYLASIWMALPALCTWGGSSKDSRLVMKRDITLKWPLYRFIWTSDFNSDMTVTAPCLCLKDISGFTCLNFLIFLEMCFSSSFKDE